MLNPFEYYAAGKNLYTATVAPVCEKYDLTYMEFTVLMFLANNPQYDTATEIVKYRHLTKSHVSISVRALVERGLLSCYYRENNRRTIHLTLGEGTVPIIRDGREAQNLFCKLAFDGFSREELELVDQFINRIQNNMCRSIPE